MPPFSKRLRPVALLSLIALGGCSEYLHRNDTLSWQSGNAVQGNKVTQMVDPWPAAAANRDIAFDGAVMETAMTRYRTGRVITPKGLSSDPVAPPPAPTTPNASPLGPTVNAQSAPVK
ncbi:pilus assembly protein [Pseudolabrys sp. FHR47]|uniref:pilus assembly protein n=1 Tax=Pseudolabrys sp. FHR47 TaxID=2562284 RepID=UPI0010BE5EB2|nr:pilus assembly protein [Pseudolabrys sp. FHR47]